MKILIVNGPNLNMLGQRDKAQYGVLSLDKIESDIKNEFPNEEIAFFQSNLEGEIVNKLQDIHNFDGVIINPGGYAHSSVAIRDALELVKIPKIEVHLSNLSTRENFRQNLITASASDGYISGFKELSYFSAIYLLKKIVE